MALTQLTRSLFCTCMYMATTTTVPQRAGAQRAFPQRAEILITKICTKQLAAMPEETLDNNLQMMLAYEEREPNGRSPACRSQQLHAVSSQKLVKVSRRTFLIMH
jgi:hypothetical protein